MYTRTRRCGKAIETRGATALARLALVACAAALLGARAFADPVDWSAYEYSFTITFPGALDELRISNVARSAEWVKATYDTIKNNTTFTIYGAARENTKGHFLLMLR